MQLLLLLLVLSLSLVFIGLPTPLLQAQGRPTIVITYTTTTPQPDGLGLQVYFALRNPDGSPVLRNEVRLNQQGKIELLDSREPPVEAQIGAPQVPLTILLLIDASGSMRPLIDEVRVAAKKAVSAAPEGSLIGVAQFAQLGPADPLGLLQSFTPNRELVGQALDAIRPAERAPTCLYNAAFQAVETLKASSTSPLERQVILLFTDGKDDDGTGNPCSSRAVENVISGARERGIPIYTIGLCDTAACANLDRMVLTDLANNTGGFSTLGQRSDLEQLFQQAMAGLSSQWVAEAIVFPSRGSNRAVLSLTLADGAIISQAFEFVSEADYAAPATIDLLPSYDEANDRYRLEIRISNPSSLDQVTLELWGNEGLVLERRLLPTELVAPLELETAGLRAGQQYCFRLRALRRGGQPMTSPRGEAYASERCVTYNPRLSFAISSVDPDW
ncbi:MAG: vWA domain-containing protein, partial [Oscillochloridaceae bacterium umkhey_bin13]